ncbi:OmpH family outer membrane protein [Gemmobacter serpentinus]|uniref:OmpH family outer membrane protein n=1 Tax=Gemmobacter serpentinus TaxID=2652247 RepID=UPI001865844E|nr:OmpH family outer membrane protein [Gemmobacter serpentinus]
MTLVALPLALLASPLAAQHAGGQAGSGGPAVAPQAYSRIAVISREDLFLRSAFGAAMLARSEAERDALQTENQRLDAALEAEERDLTTRRAGLPATEFRKLAAAFDERVRGIRAAQETKARDVTRRAEEDRATFGRAAAPVIAALMADLGASVVLDKSTVVLSLDEVDITDQAIARIDAVLGAGPAAPDAAPAANP